MASTGFNRPTVTGALARHYHTLVEVAAPHGCHFENYRAQDLRFMAFRLIAGQECGSGRHAGRTGAGRAT